MKAIGIALAASLVCATAFAQQVQIPTLQVCNFGKLSASASVYINKRADFSGNAGTMDLTAIDVACDPINGDGHPTGTISMRFSLTDSTISDMQVTLIEQMTIVGKHTPTTYLSGRCVANGGTVPCHFWLTIADNKPANLSGTPDVVGVLVLNKTGGTLTYGTGPVKSGDASVTQY